MGRIAAIDFGTARIGLAVSDERKIVAMPQPFLRAGKTIQESAQIVMSQLAKFGPIETLVIGLPLLLNGKDSPSTTMVREFAKCFTLPVVLLDERLTTSQVNKLMKEGEVSRKKRAKHADSLSATVLLQTFLEMNSI
ncbi:MAG TPA: Holliday junction resolvase RuvX [Rhabdochlamydiaceae bacterium]